MPLFMDLHIIEGITIEGVKEAHIADKSVEDKHNVELIQFWVNEEVGTVMCLLNAPDKKACVAIHQESHGNIACKVEEVEPGYFHQFMGRDHQVDQGMVRHQNGNVDLGYRFILGVEIMCHADVNSSDDFKRLSIPVAVRDLVRISIKNCGGNEMKIDVSDTLFAVFTDSKTALKCADALQRMLSKKMSNTKDPEWDITFKLGVSGGLPLTENRGFFEGVIRTAQRLSFAAGNQEILVSPIIKQLNGLEETFAESSIRVLSTSEVEFLLNLFNIVEDNIANSHFNVHSLSRAIGVSRPQLYRKIMSAAGRPPSLFIRDLRMQKALRLIRKQQYNISEVSLEVGINNPSYFSKCFRDTFGISPSKVNS